MVREEGRYLIVMDEVLKVVAKPVCALIAVVAESFSA